MIRYTKDHNDLFFTGLGTAALALSTPDSCVKAHDMMSVMQSESGVRADAHNLNGDASGLIGFMPQTLLNLGWIKGHAAFRQLNSTQQLEYVRAYYRPYKGHLHTVAGLYVATFLPALISHSDDKEFVLTAKNGPLGWAFGPNAVFDANHDYKITVTELEQAVVRNCVGPRWAELVARLAGEGLGVVDPAPPLIEDMQTRLKAAGFDPGLIDGIWGPKTRAALVAFQTSKGLVPDGIYGPLTKAALHGTIVAEMTAPTSENPRLEEPTGGSRRRKTIDADD